MLVLTTLALLFAAQEPTEEELLEEMFRLGQQAEEYSADLPPDAPRQFLDAFIKASDEQSRNTLIDTLLESDDPRAARLLRDAAEKSDLPARDRFTLAETISKRDDFDLAGAWSNLARRAPDPLLRLRALRHYRKTGAHDADRLTGEVLDTLDSEDLERNDIRSAVEALAGEGNAAAKKLITPPPKPPAVVPLPDPLPEIEPEEEEETTPAGKRKHPRKRTRLIPESEKPSPPSSLKRNLVVLTAVVIAGALVLFFRRRP